VRSHSGSPEEPAQSVGSEEPATRLRRELGLGGAVVIGLGAMLGTGVFIVFAPAATLAGSWLLVSLGLAAVVAYANAISTAQLAAVHPQAGGAYVYGRQRLSPTAGALAGYAFIIGKIASAGAAALAVGAYAWPDQQRLVAIVALVAATLIDLLGIARTAAVTAWLVAALLAVLGLVVVAGLSNPTGDRSTAPAGAAGIPLAGILAAAGLLFFAFAGYARIATLGEEVRDPARTIPRAVNIAFAVIVVVYLLVAVAALIGLGADRLAAATAPLADVVRAAGWTWGVPVVRAGGAVAAGAVLLSLIAGIGRTTFAMAAERDLPGFLAAVDERSAVPRRAELATAIAVLVVVLTGGLVGAVAVSAFTVLIYYTVANLAALRLSPQERRGPRALMVLGLVGCVALAASLPWPVVVGGAGGLAAALIIRAVVLARR
jgi:basic amino acid/polyamine antiporter, APA family